MVGYSEDPFALVPYRGLPGDLAATWLVSRLMVYVGPSMDLSGKKPKGATIWRTTSTRTEDTGQRCEEGRERNEHRREL